MAIFLTGSMGDQRISLLKNKFGGDIQKIFPGGVKCKL
jgi:hypothetical protein